MRDKPVFDVQRGHGAAYTVTAKVDDDQSTFMLLLDEIDGLSEGRLDDGEDTARAVVSYLLDRQRADDLPIRVEIGDVTASYEDAVDEIVRLRDGELGGEQPSQS